MRMRHKDDSKLVQFRVSKNIKEQADHLFADMGFDTQTALKMFLYKAVMNQRLPFDLVKTYSPQKPLTAHMKQEGYINNEGETVLPEHDEDDWSEYEKYGEV